VDVQDRVAGLVRWCGVKVVDAEGSLLCDGPLEGAGDPDLEAIDHLSRIALGAKRLGWRVVLVDVSPTLRQLLDLVGLTLEMEGQPELGEEPVRVERSQEEIHPGDLPP
jgi:hypothetical protein